MKITFKGLRASANLTQAELAEKVGISVHTAKLADKNPDRLPTAVSVKLCEFYGVSFDDILWTNDCL